MSNLIVGEINCHSCPYGKDSKWLALGDDELDLLEKNKICRIYEPKEIIYREGDECQGIYCVRRGMVVARKNHHDGKSYVLGRLGYPGSTLGYRALMAGEPHNSTAAAIRQSFICHVNAKTVHQLIQKNGALLHNFLKRVARDLGHAETEFFMNARHTVRTRLARKLMIFGKRSGNVLDDGTTVFELPLSRRDLALTIGAHPETVSRIISELRSDGIVHFLGTTVKILDEERLVCEYGENV